MTNLRIELPSGHRALRAGRQSLAGGIYLVTTTTLGRSRRFDNPEVARCVSQCFSHQGLLGDASMHAWVLMPDHAHWLIELGVRDELEVVVRRLKSASARSANRLLGLEGPLWARAYHERAMRCWQDVQAAARYIVANPVRAGLVSHAGDYPYSHTVWSGET